MHEIAAKRLKYKKKKFLQKKLDQDYLKRLSTKLDRPKYGLKKKKKVKKARVDRQKKIIYDKFSVPRKGSKPYEQP